MTRLHIFDMDGTLLRGAASVELSRYPGTFEAANAVEEAWLRGEISDVQFWERVLPLWEGISEEEIDAAFEAAQGGGPADLRRGHARPDGELAEGCVVPPTVLELPSRDVDLWRDELFGPVLGVLRADDAGAAFALAGDSAYELSAAVFTNDLGRALDAVDDLDVGVLHADSETAGADPHVPFGGAKHSGYGPKEQGRASREFLTHTTTVYLRGGRPG